MLPLPARDLQVEQDRAPAVLPHHDELARPAADQPRGHRQHHRRDHHPHRPDACTPTWTPAPTPPGSRSATAQMNALPLSPPRLARRLELHPAPRRRERRRAAARTDQERRPAELPELTGLAPGDLDQLIAHLAALPQAHREQRARSHPASDARHKPRSGRPPRLPLPRPRRGHRAPPAAEPARRHPRPPVWHQPHHDQASPRRNTGPAGPARAPHRASHLPARPAHAYPAIYPSGGRPPREQDQKRVLIFCERLARVGVMSRVLACVLVSGILWA